MAESHNIAPGGLYSKTVSAFHIEQAAVAITIKLDGLGVSSWTHKRTPAETALLALLANLRTDRRVESSLWPAIGAGVLVGVVATLVVAAFIWTNVLTLGLPLWALFVASAFGCAGVFGVGQWVRRVSQPAGKNISHCNAADLRPTVARLVDAIGALPQQHQKELWPDVFPLLVAPIDFWQVVYHEVKNNGINPLCHGSPLLKSLDHLAIFMKERYSAGVLDHLVVDTSFASATQWVHFLTELKDARIDVRCIALQPGLSMLVDDYSGLSRAMTDKFPEARLEFMFVAMREQFASMVAESGSSSLAEFFPPAPEVPSDGVQKRGSQTDSVDGEPVELRLSEQDFNELVGRLGHSRAQSLKNSLAFTSGHIPWARMFCRVGFDSSDNGSASSECESELALYDGGGELALYEGGGKLTPEDLVDWMQEQLPRGLLCRQCPQFGDIAASNDRLRQTFAGIRLDEAISFTLRDSVNAFLRGENVGAYPNGYMQVWFMVADWWLDNLPSRELPMGLFLQLQEVGSRHSAEDRVFQLGRLSRCDLLILSRSINDWQYYCRRNDTPDEDVDTLFEGIARNARGRMGPMLDSQPSLDGVLYEVIKKIDSVPLLDGVLLDGDGVFPDNANPADCFATYNTILHYWSVCMAGPVPAGLDHPASAGEDDMAGYLVALWSQLPLTQQEFSSLERCVGQEYSQRGFVPSCVLSLHKKVVTQLTFDRLKCCDLVRELYQAMEVPSQSQDREALQALGLRITSGRGPYQHWLEQMLAVIEYPAGAGNCAFQQCWSELRQFFPKQIGELPPLFRVQSSGDAGLPQNGLELSEDVSIGAP